MLDHICAIFITIYKLPKEWDEVNWSNNVLSKFIFFFWMPFFQKALVLYILSDAVLLKLSQFWKNVIWSNYLFPSKTGWLIKYILSNNLT